MDYGFLWGVIALACGTVMLVYGAAMFRVVLAFAGFYIGFALVSGWLGALTSGPSPAIQTLAAVVLGAALLVTHDIAEAVSMSDRVVVLSRRPAVVKVEMDMGALRGLPPLERRDTPEFHRYFNAIWKELDVHA